LNNTGVQKLLLAEIERLETSVSKLESFREKFYESDKLKCILEEKQKVYVFTETLYTIAISIGSILMGLSPSLKNPAPAISYNTEVFWIGVALIVVSIIAKVKK
jgi:hypothetical protein